jgi:hypothetical protein
MDRSRRAPLIRVYVLSESLTKLFKYLWVALQNLQDIFGQFAPLETEQVRLDSVVPRNSLSEVVAWRLLAPLQS